MKKIYIKLLVIVLVVCFNNLQAQVGIGTTGIPQGTLDVAFTNNGLLIPRVALVDTITATVLTPTTSELVYNTATAGAGVNAVTPGFYYWNGSLWIMTARGLNNDWTTTGNSGTNPATNFIGTTDLISLNIRTNNSVSGTAQIRVRDDGLVGINSTGVTTNRLRVINTAVGYAITSINNVASGDGFAIYGSNPNNQDGISGAMGGAGAKPTENNGVRGSGLNGLGVFGYCGNGNPANVAHNGNAAGKFILDSDNDYTTTNYSAFAKLAGKSNVDPDGSVQPLAIGDILYGGFFRGGVTGPSFSYIGIKYGHDAAGVAGTNYKIIGNGTVSTLIPDAQLNPRIMFCSEAPEVLFKDYGVGKLTNGVAYIALDKILSKNMKIDDRHPLKVFIQLEGDSEGVIVTEKTKDGFSVKEINNGTSNMSFSWQIAGNRADSKDENGKITSHFEDLRLPIGPKGLEDPIVVAEEISHPKVGLPKVK